MRNWLAEMFQGFLETPHTIGIDFRTDTRLFDCQSREILSISKINLPTCRIRSVQVCQQSVQGVLLRIPQVVRVLDHASLDFGETETSCLLVLKRRNERDTERESKPGLRSYICVQDEDFYEEHRRRLCTH